MFRVSSTLSFDKRNKFRFRFPQFLTYTLIVYLLFGLMSIQRCGFCALVTSMLRKAMCIRSRRGSTESYYGELDDQDTLKIDDKYDDDDLDDLIQEVEGVTQAVTEDGMARPHLCPGRFLTMRKKRKRKGKRKTARDEEALLDDMQVGQVQCMLHQSVTWKFNAFNLETVSGGRCLMVLCIHLFHEYGLITHFDLDVIKLWKLFSLIEDGYRNTNPYHNSVHAADVTQAMHCFLQQKEILEYLTPVEIMSSLLAAMAHDMDHPGVNQPFLIATSNHLAALYENTSVLENHHWRTAISCLIQSRLLEGSDICQEVEKQISSLIMATDITRQPEYLHRFKTLMDTNTLDMTNSDHRHLVLQIALKCADISNPCRPWDISMKWSLKVCEEFFRQGDYERKLNLPITALCDRHTTSIPKIQTGFFKYVVMPLFTQWHRFLHSDLSSEMLENLLYNQDKWDALEAEEIAKEKKRKATEELKNSLLTNISDISELLLPLRRGSLNPARPIKFKGQLRRFSVPLNLFQDTKSKYKEKDRGSLSAELRIKGIASFIGSEHSLHTQLQDQSEPNDDAEKVLSTENLLPDASKASITKPIVATRQNTIIKGGGTWKLFRQQTFPPWASIAQTHASRSKSTSNEDTIHDQTDSAKLQTDDKVRREAAIVGSRLRDNLFAMQNKSSDEFLCRTKSMPVNPTYIENERKMRELKLVMPEMLRCALTGKDFWPRRRRSAPAPVAASVQNSMRNLASPEALRHSINGSGRRPSHVLTCQQWIAKQYAAREVPPVLPRRSSLPVEVITGISSY